MGSPWRKGQGQGPVRALEDLDLHRRCSQPGIRAPCLFDGPINGEVFLAWVRKFLVPTLKPGEAVIMDNLGSHRGKAVRQTIPKARAKLLFLPKYSPDLNPIEQVFSKLKHLLRKAQAWSYREVLKAIRKHLSAFSPEECCNYLKNCGYGFV